VALVPLLTAGAGCSDGGIAGNAGAQGDERADASQGTPDASVDARAGTLDAGAEGVDAGAEVADAGIEGTDDGKGEDEGAERMDAMDEERAVADRDATDACTDEKCDGGCLPDSSACDVNTVVGIITNVTAGDFHTCALLSSGNVRCWGDGSYGRLGYGNIANIGDNETPASAGNVDVGGTVTQIAAGSAHTCALLSTGAVRCWGFGNVGRLGYGNTDDVGDNEPPTRAGNVDVGGSAIRIAAGTTHTCALLATGGVRCWGWNGYGQLGYGNTKIIGDDEAPASAGDVAVGGAVTQIVTGLYHTCALLTTGKVRCWGWGEHGQLGYGNLNNIGDGETPASVGDVDVGGTVTQLGAGSVHTCALLSTGSVRCWGDGQYGQLGYGNTNVIGDDETPAGAGDVQLGGTAIQIAVAGVHTCALLSTGSVRCWGDGQFGPLGYGNTNNVGDDETPAAAGDVDVGGAVARIAVGGRHTCALLSTGGVRCWGDGWRGDLGYGNTNNVGDDETPASAGDVPVF
jgi:alpha-tubulin suppressor-like RCC1 family protein